MPFDISYNPIAPAAGVAATSGQAAGQIEGTQLAQENAMRQQQLAAMAIRNAQSFNRDASGYGGSDLANQKLQQAQSLAYSRAQGQTPTNMATGGGGPLAKAALQAKQFIVDSQVDPDTLTDEQRSSLTAAASNPNIGANELSNMLGQYNSTLAKKVTETRLQQVEDAKEQQAAAEQKANGDLIDTVSDQLDPDQVARLKAQAKGKITSAKLGELVNAELQRKQRTDNFKADIQSKAAMLVQRGKYASSTEALNDPIVKDPRMSAARLQQQYQQLDQQKQADHYRNINAARQQDKEVLDEMEKRANDGKLSFIEANFTLPKLRQDFMEKYSTLAQHPGAGPARADAVAKARQKLGPNADPVAVAQLAKQINNEPETE